MSKIFISRVVDEGRWLKRLRGEHSITGISLIEFSSVDFELPACDWIFFYSRQGVKHFFEQYPGQLLPYKWAAMGPKTALYLQQYILDVDFIGDGHPKSVAEELLDKVSKGDTICFARAANSMKSVQTLLGTKVNMKDIVVYNNTPMQEVPNGNFDVLIFTSPLNAEIYLSQTKREPSEIIAIGESTAEKITSLGYSDINIADHPDEEVLIQLVKTLI